MLDNVIKAARLSEFVYRPDDWATEDAKNLGFDKVRHIGNGGFHAMVCENDQEVWVVFRGTQLNDPFDSLTNARIWPLKTPYGRIHAGFYHIARYYLGQYNTDCQTPDKTIYFTGHSQGAALATVAAVLIGKERASSGKTLPRLITFGSPRVGNKEFAENVKDVTQSVIRVTNNNDPVTLIPIGIFSYWHVQTHRYHFTEKGRLRINPSRCELLLDRPIGFIRFLQEAVTNYLRDGNLVRSCLDTLQITDHYSHNYVRICESAKVESR